MYMIYLLLDFLILHVMIRYMVSYYNTILFSLFINCYDTLDLYSHNTHDTTYDTFIVASFTNRFWSGFLWS
jgi:hypothetical protein